MSADRVKSKCLLYFPLIREYLPGASASNQLSNPHHPWRERPHGAQLPPTAPPQTHQGITVGPHTHKQQQYNNNCLKFKKLHI